MDLQYILLRRKFVVVLEDMCNQPSLTKILYLLLKTRIFIFTETIRKPMKKPSGKYSKTIRRNIFYEKPIEKNGVPLINYKMPQLCAPMS